MLRLSLIQRTDKVLQSLLPSTGIEGKGYDVYLLLLPLLTPSLLHVSE